MGGGGYLGGAGEYLKGPVLPCGNSQTAAQINQDLADKTAILAAVTRKRSFRVRQDVEAESPAAPARPGSGGVGF